MKVIARADLVLLLCHISNRNNFSADDLEKILDTYGDDYFIEGNRFVKTTENSKMKKIRDSYSASMEIVWT